MSELTDRAASAEDLYDLRQSVIGLALQVEKLTKCVIEQDLQMRRLKDRSDEELTTIPLLRERIVRLERLTEGHIANRDAHFPGCLDVPLDSVGP